jgi:phosphatidylglycerophosphate synthase
MFDARLRPVIDPTLSRIGRWLAGHGVGANAVTVAGFVVGMGAVGALSFRADGLALALIVANRALDGLDGAVARHSAPTDLGGYLDIVLDFIFYAAVVFGFAVGRPEFALPGAFLILAFVGTGTSFLAYAIFAAKRGLDSSRHGRKSLYFLGGLTEGAETIALFCAFCLWPSYFPWMAWGFGAACWVTTATRIGVAVSTLR